VPFQPEPGTDLVQLSSYTEQSIWRCIPSSVVLEGSAPGDHRSGQGSGEFHLELTAETAPALVRAAYFDALFRWLIAEPRSLSSYLVASMIARPEVVLAGLRVPPPATLSYSMAYSGTHT
jgi:hypothetical protein